MPANEDHLFKLIKSLSASEKRYFSIYASRHTMGEGNNSVRMLKKLDVLKEYHEKKFLEKNKKEAFAKHYRFNKHFLYNLILDSLRAYHAGKTPQSVIRELIQNAEILIEKGLFAEALLAIREAKAKAIKYEFQELHLEVLRQELHLYREQSLTEISEKAIDDLVDQFRGVLKDMDSVLSYEWANLRIGQRISKAGFARTSQSLEELARMDPHAVQKEAPPQFAAAWNFYNSKVAITFIRQDFEKALVEIDALINLINAHPHMSAAIPRAYINVLHNKIVLLNNLKRYREVDDVAQKIDAIPVRTQVMKNRKFYSSHNLLLSMYPKTGEFEKGLRLLETMEKKLETGEVQFLNPIHRLTHCFSAANIHFCAGHFAVSNKFLQEIIDRGDVSPRSDIVAYARIMRMIVQFEMGKQDLLEYTVRSVYRFLYKRKRIYKFEDIILRFIRKKAPAIESPREMIQAFVELHAELLPLTRDTFERNAFAYFDMLSWLESKIYNKSFSDIVKEKAAAFS